MTDVSGAVIVGAECKLTNIETNVSTSTTTNQDGIYVIPDLRPANYPLTIQEGDRTIAKDKLDARSRNLTGLQRGCLRFRHIIGLIAFHSLDGVYETGLLICLPEKMAETPAGSTKRSAFSCPV